MRLIADPQDAENEARSLVRLLEFLGPSNANMQTVSKVQTAVITGLLRFPTAKRAHPCSYFKNVLFQGERNSSLPRPRTLSHLLRCIVRLPRMLRATTPRSPHCSSLVSIAAPSDLFFQFKERFDTGSAVAMSLVACRCDTGLGGLGFENEKHPIDRAA